MNFWERIDKLPLARRKQAITYAYYVKCRWPFITDLCWTYDEVDPDNPVKLIPPLEYLRQMLLAWEQVSLLAITKSRRMIVTWTLLALDLHTALTVPYSSVFVASDDQVKSDKLLNRVEFMFNHLSNKFYKPKPIIHHGQGGDPTKIEFPALGSKIEALSQNPDKLRQEGATLLHFEEVTAWQWPEEAWKAARPTVQGGGKVVMVSSARAGTFFKKVVFDELGLPVGQG